MYHMYNAVMWFTFQFAGPLCKWWLNRKTQGLILDTFYHFYRNSQDDHLA
jgi:hypothetical protein